MFPKDETLMAHIHLTMEDSIHKGQVLLYRTDVLLYKFEFDQTSKSVYNFNVTNVLNPNRVNRGSPVHWYLSKWVFSDLTFADWRDIDLAARISHTHVARLLYHHKTTCHFGNAKFTAARKLRRDVGGRGTGRTGGWMVPIGKYSFWHRISNQCDQKKIAKCL